MAVFKPHIHLNGSSAVSIFAAHKAVYKGAMDLKEKIRATAPHMRDFYPLQNGAELFKEAQKQFEADLKAVDEIEARALAIALHVQEYADKERGSRE